MARKVSMPVTWPKFQKQNDRHITSLMSNGVVLLKRPYISLIIALQEVMA